ncbi:MAG: AMP-binding protein [Nitriliruptoraceae bacterium]
MTTTLTSLVRERADATPDLVAMRAKSLGIWQDINWATYHEQASRIAHALAALGVCPGDRVAIHSENRPEWLYTDAAIGALRAITVGLYPTNPAPEVKYLLTDSGSKILIAEDQEQVDKALEIEAECPELTHIVYLEARGVRDYTHPKLLAYDTFLRLGDEHRAAHPDLLARHAKDAHPDDPATLIYTSGTTGPPKGAVLTHGNIAFAIKILVHSGGFFDPPPDETDVALSYLPLCHVAERAATIWTNAASGAVVHFAESIDTVQTNLREVQPTLFFAVPRIWEKIAAGIHVKMASASRFKRLNFAVWMRTAQFMGERIIANNGSHTALTRVLYAIGYPLFYRALKDRIGMRKVRAAGSGAAPIAPEILQFFFGIGVPIYEIYGMTENSAIATVNRRGRVKLGTVGEPQDGTELKIDEITGEILTRHPANFVGYWNNEAATKATLDADGWLHTGDMGEWIDGTHVRIVDRIKDIIITAGGKNISPSEIENALKSSPYVKEAVIIGDKRPYLTALIGIELDTVANYAQRHRISYTTYRDLTEKPEVLTLMQKTIMDVNSRYASVEQVRKFRMLFKELDHEEGDLTATQKVKRSVMLATFAYLVDEMYANATSHAGGDLTQVHPSTAAVVVDEKAS